MKTMNTTARPNPKDLINHSPFTEYELESKDRLENIIKLAKQNGYNDAIHECFMIIQNENIPVGLKIRLMEMVNNLTKK